MPRDRGRLTLNEIRIFASAPADSPAAALSAELRRVAQKKDLKVFLLLDASRSPDTRFILETLTDDALCLFDGQTFQDLAEVAPWLVPLSLRDGDAVFDWFMEEAFGRDQGIFLFTKLEPRQLKTSLKRALKVQDDTGRDLYFKYYRPAVFNDYLPAFDPDQAAYVMRDLDQVWTEDAEAPDRLRRYALREGELRRADLSLTLAEDA